MAPGVRPGVIDGLRGLAYPLLLPVVWVIVLQTRPWCRVLVHRSCAEFFHTALVHRSFAPLLCTALSLRSFAPLIRTALWHRSLAPLFGSALLAPLLCTALWLRSLAPLRTLYTRLWCRGSDT